MARGDREESRSDLFVLNEIEQRYRRGVPLRSTQWMAPMMVGGIRGRRWDVKRCDLITQCRPPVVCRCVMELIEYESQEWIEFHTNFHASAFEDGFSWDDPDGLLLHARLHVREFLNGVGVPRPRSCGEWPIVFECTGRE